MACLAQLVNVIAPIMTENNGRAWVQTIFYPYLHASRFGRGWALQTLLSTTKHDTKDFTDVPDVDALTVWNEEGEELTVFAVNRDFEEDNLLTVNLKDFEGYVPTEQIELVGFDLHAVNTAQSQPVKPTAKALSGVYTPLAEVKLRPLSWNVIRFVKK